MSLKFWILQLIMNDSQERAICQRCAHICRRKACLTSAISETTVVAHGTEVLEHEDGDGRNQQQHDEHHDPDVSAEGLCGRRTETDASHGNTDRQTEGQTEPEPSVSPRNADGETVPLLRETMTLMPVSMKGTEKSMTSDLSSLMVSEPTAM